MPIRRRPPVGVGEIPLFPTFLPLSVRAVKPRHTPIMHPSFTVSNPNLNTTARRTMDKPRSKRWAPISGSANAAESYKERCRRLPAERVYAYECWCGPPFTIGDDDSDEGSDMSSAKSWSDTDSETHGDEDEIIEDGRDGTRPQKSRCDAGKTCLCAKPANDHPDHPWITTKAGKMKYLTQFEMMALRCPENFDMHIYSGFESLGAVEVFENLVIDFVESEDNWQEQWAICEALAFFLLQSDVVDSLMAYVFSRHSILFLWDRGN